LDYDLVVRNGLVFLSDGKKVSADIGIDGKKISRISKQPLHGSRIVNAHGLPVIPGGVDAHAHIFDKNFTYREDWGSGTESALFGGVTTVINMVLTTPIDSPARVSESIRSGNRNAFADFSLHAGMMNGRNVKNVGAISRLGVRSFKNFTCRPYMESDDEMLRVLDACRKNGCVANFHAENETIIDRATRKVKASGRTDAKAHPDSRPAIAEIEAIHRISQLTDLVKCRTHISHVSTAIGARIIGETKGMTGETCPHYLVFTRDDMKDAYLKMNPPLRTKKDVAGLWNALRDGLLDIVTSEHAPGTREEKSKGIWDSWGGVPGIETMIPVLYTYGVMRKRITLQRMIEVACTAPARIFGLNYCKGAIKPGMDADLVVLDIKAGRRVRGDELHSKCGWTPFEGRMLSGFPDATIVRGRVAVLQDDRQIQNKKDRGRFVPMNNNNNNKSIL